MRAPPCIGGVRSRRYQLNTLLFVDPAFRHFSDVRKPISAQPFLRILPRTICGINGSSDTDEQDDGTKERRQRDEEVGDKKEDDDRCSKKCGLVRYVVSQDQVNAHRGSGRSHFASPE